MTNRAGQNCRVVSFQSTRRSHRQRPAQTLGSAVAEAILSRWGAPVTSGNLDAIESAIRVPVAQLAHLSSHLPRWILSDVGREIRRA